MKVRGFDTIYTTYRKMRRVSTISHCLKVIKFTICHRKPCFHSTVTINIMKSKSNSVETSWIIINKHLVKVICETISICASSLVNCHTEIIPSIYPDLMKAITIKVNDIHIIDTATI